MPFSAGLRQSLYVRDRQVGFEISRGDSLEEVLDRHLLTVEQMARGEIITSILILSPDGTRLFHGAAPNLPSAYREVIDGLAIGPVAGSCGTAAFFRRPVYVADIANDPLWANYRHYALPHGLRSCWSTPILGTGGTLLGTFAIYGRTVGDPSDDEIEAIDMIRTRVAQAIALSRAQRRQQTRTASHLKLVSESSRAQPDAIDQLENKIGQLEALLVQLERLQISATSSGRREALLSVGLNTKKLADLLREYLKRLR